MFLFQAEDGIRDRDVTGVQTFVLPSSRGHTSGLCERRAAVVASGLVGRPDGSPDANKRVVDSGLQMDMGRQPPDGRGRAGEFESDHGCALNQTTDQEEGDDKSNILAAAQIVSDVEIDKIELRGEEELVQRG